MARRRPVRDSSAGGASATSQYRAAFERYLTSEVGASRNTVSAYTADVGVFSDWLRDTGGPGVTTLTLATLTDYVRHLSETGLAATSVARKLVSVKMFLRYLQLEGVVDQNAAELLSSPKLWRHLPTVLSPENVERLLSEPGRDDAHGLRDRAVLALMYACGARASEVCELRMASVNLKGRQVRLFGKGRKERLVSLSTRACAAAEDYLRGERAAVRRDDTDWLFLSRGGRPLSRQAIWDLVKKYATRIGCAGVSPHTLRHSFATHMLAGGAEIRALQELLGHASIRTTQVYTQVDSSRMKAVHSQCHPRG